MIDFHNHLIPGVDDGAASLDESRAAIATMQAQGITTIITTPHLSGSMLSRAAELADYMNCVDAGWEQLRALAQREFPAMRLERGVELRVDVPRLDLSNSQLRLAGTRFVLVEFPWGGIPPNSAQALFDIRMSGYTPIVAHPERYAEMDSGLAIAEEWRRVGAHLQVNEGSLVGQYGARARDLAWALLSRGWASYLCSDYHARGDCPTAAARDALLRAGGELQWQLLGETNGTRLLAGEEPESVAPLPARKSSGWLNRLFG